MRPDWARSLDSRGTGLRAGGQDKLSWGQLEPLRTDAEDRRASAPFLQPHAGELLVARGAA